MDCLGFQKGVLTPQEGPFINFSLNLYFPQSQKTFNERNFIDHIGIHDWVNPNFGHLDVIGPGEQ